MQAHGRACPLCLDHSCCPVDLALVRAWHESKLWSVSIAHLLIPEVKQQSQWLTAAGWDETEVST